MRFSMDDSGDLIGPGIPRRPALHRVFAVAAGLSGWNKEEEAWIAENPEWLEFCAQLKGDIKDADLTARHRLAAEKVFADCDFHV